MLHSSAMANQTLIKTAASLLMNNGTYPTRDTIFDPFRYEFDAETMIEPFTYFHDGPTESRPKVTDFASASTARYPWFSASSRSVLSSPDEFSTNLASPTMTEPAKNRTNLSQQVAQSPTSYPKTICRHCKSHNMPECLYTSHSMYDESGAIFCPVLKKCHCANCIRVTTSNLPGDDDSDDDNSIRSPSLTQPWNRRYGTDLREHPYAIHNNQNNTF